MFIVRVLKRKDASSIVVAIVVGMVLYNLVMTITGKWAGNLAGLDDGQYFSGTAPNADWQGQYLYPTVWAALQLLALEVLGWVYVWVWGAFKKK